MAKEIKWGNDAREAIKKGIDKACDAVRPTLGVVGMSAIIEFPGLDPIDCDDGVTILKNLEFKDHYENLGLQKLRKAAIRTSQEGGDGTATTTVLTHALISEAFKEIENDSSKIREVRDRLTAGLNETLQELSKIKRDIGEDDIERIAKISSLDDDVAKIITEIIKEVGVNGVVTVEKGQKLGYSKEVVKGARFNSGWISPYFINDPNTGTSILEDAYVIIVDRKVSTNEQILPILNSIGTGKSILIIADDVDSVALATLAVNANRGNAKIACVRNPYNASRGRDFLFDMAALTGATVISEEMGMRLDKVTAEVCGRAEKVVVTRDNTTVIGGKGMTDVLDARISTIENKINETTSDYEKEMLEERLATLTGGIGVIRVGAYTDTEFNAKKYKFDNAINATQAALQEGIVAGGGVALIDVSMVVNESIFKIALKAPFLQMAVNAGYDEDEFEISSKQNLGIDFKTGEEVDMFEAGIIDPFKVLRLALESAVSIATSLITIETAIVLEDKKLNE